MTNEERLEKINDKVDSACIGLERLSAEIAEMRRGLVSLSDLPKELIEHSSSIKVNQNAILRIERENEFHKKRMWALFVSTITALISGFAGIIGWLFYK